MSLPEKVGFFRLRLGTIVMQYLMVDAHQRFLGTIVLDAPLKVGAKISTDAKTYMVVGIRHTGNKQALMVIPS